MSSSDLHALVDMGFEKPRAEMALRTGSCEFGSNVECNEANTNISAKRS